jgi:tetratricopeptide (TPR) repeat protein
MKMNNKAIVSSIVALMLCTTGCQNNQLREDDIAVHYIEAEKAVLEASYEEALTRYSAVLECLELPSHQLDGKITRGIVYFNIGYCYEQLGDVSTAIDYYLKSKKEGDAPVLADIALGSIYFQMKEYDVSKEYFQSAINEDVNAYEAYVNLSAIYSLEHDDDQALALLTKAIEIDVTKPDAYLNRAYLFASLGNEDMMNQDIKKLKAMKVNSLDVYVKIFNDTLEEVRN